jgi:GT2 family glycosyltransferase
MEEENHGDKRRLSRSVGSSATIIIPTRGRPDYLAVTLASIRDQARRAAAEVIVVDDGRDPANEQVAAAYGASYLALGSPRGPNAARNAGIATAKGDLLIFLDDDIEAPASWLAAYLDAAGRLPEVAVFTGPIRARLEGRPRRTCGREGAPITHMDHGDQDRDVPRGWSANLAIRRDAFAAVGLFDEQRFVGAGDEEEWEERYLAGGGRIRYVAAASLVHRRSAKDARALRLARASARRGAMSRNYDEFKGTAPSLAFEFRGLAGAVWHTIRRRCANGPLMVAHGLGRIAAALRRAPGSAPGDPRDDFLSGESGTIGGRRDMLREFQDRGLDALALPARIRLALAARRVPPTREVLVLSAVRPERADTYEAALDELRRTRHTLTVARCDAGTGGRFENFNALLAAEPLEQFDWLLLLDDDVVLPRGFLDGMLHQAEQYGLRLAQPAHRIRSHAAWRVTRRHRASTTRETAFVEIGPATLLHRDTFAELLPFPPLRMGWGVDAYWAAVARDHGWPIGVVDVLTVAHRIAPAAGGYSREEAVAEARTFLAEHPYLPAADLQRTLAVHRRCA